MNQEDKNNLLNDGLRYLAQQLETGKLHWAQFPEKGPGKPFWEEVNKQKTISSNSPKNDHKQTDKEQVIQTVKENIPEAVPTIPLPGEIEDPFPQFTNLDSFREAISRCQKCPLGETRNNFVFGVGNPDADLVLVGEAPGAEEDARGIPFVGRAGQLLDKILEAVQLTREKDVFIANILKCRPPNNRDPRSNEVEKCEPYLIKQLQLLNPKVIMALGRIAGQTILRTSDSLTKMRGKVHDYHGIPLLITFHPAALLRNPQWKHPTWEDVQRMKAILEDKRQNS